MAGKKRAARPAAGQQWTPKQVVDLAMAHDLAEIEVESGGVRVRVVRRHAPAAATQGAAAAPAALPQAESVERAAEAAAGTVTIEAPMVGTFYRATNPETAPFVSEGDTIKEGQTLCIIEAMKLMNEIESKVTGRVVKILVENAQPVEFGQPLFLVECRK
ncbi:MAG: acetyl-CoA carboxylase biotin carboxyl carrier protein [Candidatus Rokubacteria bacterium]|nr:acetyl-CoA carboxylase biotin carboxyl carrier protein [Candidatus Rokubacteria bacterium]